MRTIAWVLAAGIVLAAGHAYATQDHYSDIDWVAAWTDVDAFIVESSSWSPEADGQDLRVWWSVHQPAGVAQAVIMDPYSKKPWLKRPKKSTIPKDKLDALVAGLATANQSKPRPKPTAVRDTIAPTLGITGLSEVKPCPAKVKVGKKTVTVTIGDVTAEAGPSELRVSQLDKMDVRWGTVGESQRDRRPSMKPICMPHAAGVLVKIRLHMQFEGDNYVQRIAFLPGAKLP